MSGAGLAAVSSPWVASTNSQARLISGTVEIDGKPTLLAGVQMRMDPGWKTYWKNPGDSGVPPGFNWSGSKNLKSAEVLYPAPQRFADGSGTAIGYSQEVVFPVKVTPEREGEPVELKLTFDYGLCMDLCIPNETSLSLTLPAGATEDPGEALLLADVLARVPRPEAPDALPRVGNIDARLGGPEPHLKVEVLFDPKATGTDLFISAGRVFVPVPKSLGPVAEGRQGFEVPFGSAKEAEALKGKSLTLTLVSDQGSSETAWTAE
ncbi:MAG: protein-disulfide reductase DsbD domain-containing protein [Methyloceanibacter sp.]